MIVAGAATFGAGGGATVTVEELVVTDHSPFGRPGICGKARPGEPAGTDADASGPAINTGRDDTTPDDDAAAAPTPPADPDPTTERLLDPDAPADDAPAPDEPADPPRADAEPPSEDDDAPGSATATTGATNDAPTATVNAPATNNDRSRRRVCSAASTTNVWVPNSAASRLDMGEK